MVTFQIQRTQLPSISTKHLCLPQQETLGQIVMDILNEGRHLNRKALCTKLLSRLDRARAPEEESHYQTLIGLLFAGQGITSSIVACCSAAVADEGRSLPQTCC